MGKNVVLFVDDEDNILNSIKRAIIDEDYTALFTNSPTVGLKIVREQEISVLVTDMMMPDMDGLTFLKETKILCPATIRVVLSGYTELSRVLAAINQGDIFRYITKPWDMEADLLSVVRQGVEYYNLRREKQELEKSLQQKNNAYLNMLRTLNEKFYSKQGDLDYLNRFLDTILLGLESDFSNPIANSHSKSLVKLRTVRKISNDFFQTMPVMIEEFTVQDVVDHLNKYLLENNYNMRYCMEADNSSLKCIGNFKLFMMILSSVAMVVCRLGSNRRFKHIITSNAYHDKNVARISNVVEFGYVDGAKVLIDTEELLSHDNLEFFTSLLARLGQPFKFDVAYTYVNQNTSLIAMSAEFNLG